VGSINSSPVRIVIVNLGIMGTFIFGKFYGIIKEGTALLVKEHENAADMTLAVIATFGRMNGCCGIEMGPVGWHQWK
jgi:hypothetical protein